jgi:ribosomal protein S18 acetylase RimI-like enzyme
MPALRILDVLDAGTFGRIPPCADPRFDHRTCDYWEDADRGSKASRPGWLDPVAPPAPAQRRAVAENPFAPPPREAPENPFAPSARPATATAFTDLFADEEDAKAVDNPFAPTHRIQRGVTSGVPRKLALLDRGRGVFGSYAKVLEVDGEAVAYAQFGPLSAYPRALRLRDLYPQLPSAPLPAVITCIATTAEARRQGHAAALVQEVCRDLAERGFAAVESYPDLTRPEDETSAARPAFWQTVGFSVAVDDERFPVMRRDLE